jgi:hypothetical protein
MRTLDGRLIINLDDNKSEFVVGTLDAPQSSSINENQTEYVLYPEQINRLPIIEQSIVDASTPQIQREELSYKDKIPTLYLSADGLVRVVVGSSFRLRIKAKQPDTLNVENGIPTQIPRTEGLIYNWNKDGDIINSEIHLDGYPDSFIRVNGPNELVFRNITTQAGGLYSCEVTNDIGSVTSETINLVVYNPDSTFDSVFKQNLVQNPIATSDEGWSSVIGNIIARPLLKDAEGKESILVQAKRPESQIRGYNSGMFYPNPSTIKVNNEKGLAAQLRELSANNAGYFTRENFTYAIAGGVRKVIGYQDIDLSNITDYISGRVYGVDGIKAIVGCYIGNGITRYTYTERILNAIDRANPAIYDQTEPRISSVNFKKAGFGLVNETIKVVIQELADEEPLRTKLYNQATNKIVEVNNITFTDPVSKAIQSATTNNKQPYQIILDAYRNLYRNKTYYSNGQYVEYNIGYLDSLNKKTNKIRIYLIFDTDEIRLYEKWNGFTDNGELYDINSWERFYTNDTYDLTTDQVGQNFIVNRLRTENPDPTKLIPVNAESRGMVTGLNVSLYPLTPTNKVTVSSDNTKFAKGIIKI